MHFRLLIVLAVSALAACQSTGVIPMGQDSYYIGKKDGTPGIGVSLSNKAEVYKEANEFCTKKGLEVSVVRETVMSSLPGRLGSTEVHFKCVPPGGSGQGTGKAAGGAKE